MIDVEKGYNYYKVARNCTNLMLFLVNDILDFAQLEDNKIVLNANQDVSLDSLLSECLEVLRFKSDSKGLALNYTIGEAIKQKGGHILTDGNRLK